MVMVALLRAVYKDCSLVIVSHQYASTMRHYMYVEMDLCNFQSSVMMGISILRMDVIKTVCWNRDSSVCYSRRYVQR